MTASAPKGYANNLPHMYAEEPTAAKTAYAAPVSNLDRLHGNLHILPVWRAVRGVLFEPCKTLDRGYPWEDLQ